MLASSIGLKVQMKVTEYTKNLILNNFFNAAAKQTSTQGQAAVSACMLYYLVGARMNILFEDELADINYLNRICDMEKIQEQYINPLWVVPSEQSQGLAPFLVGGIVGRKHDRKLNYIC